MKKMYKMIALILCIAMIAMLAGCSESTYQGGNNGGKAVTSGNDVGNGKQVGKDRLSQDGVEYLVANGKLTISGNGTVTKDAVAAMLPEYNIVDFESGNLDVGDDAFNGYTNITKIILRNNVYNIGARAFKGCSIPLIAFGNSITDIGDGAFEECCLKYVFINNEYIFQNFNSRYDFGGVGATASGIFIYKDLIPYEYNSDYSEYESIAGDFLTSGGMFDELAPERGATAVEQRHHYNQCFHESNGYFFQVLSGGEGAWDMINEYDSDRNIMDYHIDINYWKDKGIDIEFYNKENLDGQSFHIPASNPGGDTSGNSDGGSSGESKTGGSSSGGSKPSGGNTITRPNKNNSCSSCGGSGKKDCTSCNNGYITDYESGQYMGYGSPTREVKKKCMVCQGSGKVKCYH